MAANQYLTVTDLNYYITQKFKRDPYLHRVLLQGELSNFRYRRNAHQYFSLKDEKSKINAVMFRSAFDKIKFRPEEGMKVYVSGYVSVYGPSGSYQFYAEKMEPAGLGALYEQLEQLKQKLTKEGLLAAEHKKPLPPFPDKIAVVTSAAGAVIHDILVTVNRRYPHAEVDLFPAQVQGDKAAASLVAAMQQIAAAGSDYDVLIIGRGGGSLEDLWPFNEEAVVRQVYQMPMPVISSVGHETDVTLCDLVASVRAATPTAAAEYATPNLSDVLAKIHQFESRLLFSMQGILRVRREFLTKLQQSVVLRQPTRLYDQQSQLLDQLQSRLTRAMQSRLTQTRANYMLAAQQLASVNPAKRFLQAKQQASYLAHLLQTQMRHYLANQRAAFAKVDQKLLDYSPQATLTRGYIYASSPDQKQTVSSVAKVSVGSPLRLYFKDGEALVQVNQVRKTSDDREK
ncbi:MAG: exodeoxyribonuclease VII large subunit [Lactobacillus sp.]|nr:exodeoxyribonuclease VII large subunit [Lactobacillus sp.]MDN6042741.1 exodeoxyribonuclease VII large subunit [Lactobacillus sp.]MDN6052255.1 exodeoxyribonuclease VII large subunit [Lactobacillus sp.]